MNWREGSIQDRRIEVVAVTGSLHLAQLKLGLTSCLKVAQGTNVELRILRPLPMQVDGEPWVQNSCTVKLDPCDQAAMLQRRDDQVTDDVSDVLNWAERNKVISTKQKLALVQEFSRRLEIKNAL